MRLRRAIVLALAICLFAVLGWAGPAEATFPGQNGKIVFSAFAPDGTAGIFAADPGGGGEPVLLVSEEGSPPRLPVDPAWSADGKRLAYSFGGISVRDAGGTSRIGGHNLTAHPAWSPNGTRIAYDSEHVTGGPGFCCDTILDGLWTIASDGSGDSPLAAPPAADPAWSPDGTKIAFEYESDGKEDIWVMNADGTGTANLTRHNSTFTESIQPSWSPDGTKLAFASGSVGDYQLHVIRADGGGEQQLTFGEQDSFSPIWSPDGTKIAFARGRSVWVMRADGSPPIQLVSGAISLPFYVGELDWQPLVGPQREDFKNSSSFCKAERDFLGQDGFASRYGNLGHCVSRH
jgi:Tol biopolymer transport system component